jgi:hypothetical protein
VKLRKAVNAMCRSCTYDPTDLGTAAQQIACCTCRECPLHAVRPVTTKEIPAQLLEHWNLRPAQLDGRAKAKVSPWLDIAAAAQKEALAPSELICRGTPDE